MTNRVETTDKLMEETMSASAEPTGLGGPEGLEPPSRLHASHAIPSAAICALADLLDREGHAWLIVAEFTRSGGTNHRKALEEATAAAECYLLADTLRKRAEGEDA